MAIKKSVVVMGKWVLGIKVAEWFLKSTEYELLAVVPNKLIPFPLARSLDDWAEENKVPIVASGHYQDIPGASDAVWTIDLVVSVGYDRIVKEWFIKKCRKIINIHNSLLPKYRGVSPVNWALKNGEREHGVTIHEITPGIDSGPIIAQVSFPINPEMDEVIDVFERCLNFGWKLFKETMPKLWDIKPVPQDESKAIYYSQKDAGRLEERRDFTREESLRKMGLPVA